VMFKHGDVSTGTYVQ